MEYIYNALLQIRLWFYCIFFQTKLQNYSITEKEGYDLMFSDEFDLEYLDAEKWNTSNCGCRVHPGDPTKYRSDNNVMINYNLNLMSDNANFHISDCGNEYDIKYTYGLIENYKYFSQLENTYGYYEIRCKISKGVGMWPAFWLWGINSWPPEIDIFEFWTTDKCNWFNSNYHWMENDNHKQKPYTHRTLSINLSENFHLYGLKWTKNYLKFYFDNMLIRKIWVNESTPMRIVANNGIDTEKIKNDDLPSVFEVDWIRYWSKN
jgi:beta-glucanase (GH16 family)